MKFASHLSSGIVNFQDLEQVCVDFPSWLLFLRDKMIKAAFDKNLIVGACGVNSIRFRPSLNFSRGEAEQAINILADCAQELDRAQKAPVNTTARCFIVQSVNIVKKWSIFFISALYHFFLSFWGIPGFQAVLTTITENFQQVNLSKTLALFLHS